jgi:hypothetical protein
MIGVSSEQKIFDQRIVQAAKNWQGNGDEKQILPTATYGLRCVEHLLYLQVGVRKTAGDYLSIACF